jgi:O-antigen/teichoic acid export membrane protein
MRAYPGILLAQHRFHWVSLVQAIIPWVQLLAFYLLLRAGYGVRAYLPSVALSYLVGWGIWLFVVHLGEGKFRFVSAGLERERIVSLFSFGGSIALMGITGAVLSSLPAMLLTKAGGLALVPVFAFTMRGVSMLAQLSHRTSHAFYPGMQRLYVAGKTGEFSRRYKAVQGVSVAIGLATAGLALVFNPALISWLAAPEYFAGPWTNFWFAIGLVVGSLSGGFANLLQISGDMGKMALVAPAQLLMGIVAGWFGYQWYGLPGLAAVFSVGPPLCKGLYALWRGAKNCGFGVMAVGGSSLLLATAGCLVLWGGAIFLDHASLPSFSSFSFLGRQLVLPPLRDILLGISLAGFGALLAILIVRGVREPSGQEPGR